MKSPLLKSRKVMEVLTESLLQALTFLKQPEEFQALIARALSLKSHSNPMFQKALLICTLRILKQMQYSPKAFAVKIKQPTQHSIIRILSSNRVVFGDDNDPKHEQERNQRDEIVAQAIVLAFESQKETFQDLENKIEQLILEKHSRDDKAVVQQQTQLLNQKLVLADKICDELNENTELR